VVECVCPDDVVKMRLEKRMKENNNPSDGRWEILQEQRKQFENIDEVPADCYFRVDTSSEPEIFRQNLIGLLKMKELLNTE